MFANGGGYTQAGIYAAEAPTKNRHSNFLIPYLQSVPPLLAGSRCYGFVAIAGHESSIWHIKFDFFLQISLAFRQDLRFQSEPKLRRRNGIEICLTKFYAKCGLRTFLNSFYKAIYKELTDREVTLVRQRAFTFPAKFFKNPARISANSYEP